MCAIHVDDTLMTGHPKWLEWFKAGIGKRFDYTDQGRLKKHLGVEYKWYHNEEGC